MTSLVSLNLPKQTNSLGYAYIFDAHYLKKNKIEKELDFIPMEVFAYAFRKNQFNRSRSEKFLVKKTFTTWINNPYEKVQIPPSHLKFPPYNIPTSDTAMLGYVARSAGKECYIF